MLYVSDNPDDSYPMDLRVARPANSLAERIFILKPLAHQCIVCDADEWRSLIEVLWTKIAPLPQRDLHGFEVVAQHAARFQARFVTGRDWRSVLDEKIVVERVAAERQLADHRGLYARQ